MYFQKRGYYSFKEYEHFCESLFFRKKVFFYTATNNCFVPVSQNLTSIGCYPSSTLFGEM